MYCKNCGANVDDKAAVCPSCGAQVNGIAAKKNTIAIVGFIFSFLFAIVGLICSILGYKKSKTDGAPHGGLALAGIIISIVNMILGIIINVSMF